MAVRGTGSVLCSTVLKVHFFRWSDILGTSVKPQDDTGLKAVLNRQTLFLTCHDTATEWHRSHRSSTIPLLWRRLAHTSLMVRDTSDNWHRLKLSRNLAMCHSISVGSSLNCTGWEALVNLTCGQGWIPKDFRCLSWTTFAWALAG